MLSIVTLPNKILRTRSKELDPDILLSKEIQELTKEMIPIMYTSDGIGLAAPQVGKNIRLCIIGKEATPEKVDDLVLVNPIWTKLSRKKLIDVEGCLSVPKTFGRVSRYKDIVVNALDKSGKEIKFEAHDFFARVIQHEVDHLDGILFIDKAKGIYTID